MPVKMSHSRLWRAILHGKNTCGKKISVWHPLEQAANVRLITMQFFCSIINLEWSWSGHGNLIAELSKNKKTGNEGRGGEGEGAGQWRRLLECHARWIQFTFKRTTSNSLPPSALQKGAWFDLWPQPPIPHNPNKGVLTSMATSPDQGVLSYENISLQLKWLTSKWSIYLLLSKLNMQNDSSSKKNSSHKLT